MDKLTQAQRVLAETKYLSELGDSEDYERFESLVELRQSLVDQIDAEGELSPELKKVVQELFQYDTIILGHMQRIKNEAAEALIRLNGYKKQIHAYGNQGHLDGLMFDRRN
ncbi:hypothetical protein [Paenibacillus sp. CF384]|uniref:hypothetical protein n=1 Tax=Paenibacillus sp. CF384 TaxID=1884382 RepID=UPI00089509A9|nr:hypothetical protein [Paenibacillus sp. CF384]SDX28534.1 hypothetical protein SAMN05518855_1011158 [Paenibacillus sp. CF384]